MCIRNRDGTKNRSGVILNSDHLCCSSGITTSISCSKCSCNSRLISTSSRRCSIRKCYRCLLYTSDAADERSSVDLGGRRIIKKKKNTKNRSGVILICFFKQKTAYDVSACLVGSEMCIRDSISTSSRRCSIRKCY